MLKSDGRCRWHEHHALSKLSSPVGKPPAGDQTAACANASSATSARSSAAARCSQAVCQRSNRSAGGISTGRAICSISARRMSPASYSRNRRVIGSPPRASAASRSSSVVSKSRRALISSSTSKRGSTPASAAFWRRMSAHNAWMVSMRALSIALRRRAHSAACRSSAARCASSNRLRSAPRTRSRISWAAFWVKVMATSWLSSQSSWASSRARKRSTSTNVLPDPAPATTIRLRSWVWMAALCSGVRFTPGVSSQQQRSGILRQHYHISRAWRNPDGMGAFANGGIRCAEYGMTRGTSPTQSYGS